MNYEFLASLATMIGVIFGVITYYRDSRRKSQLDTLEAYHVLQKETLSKLNEWKPREIKEAVENRQTSGYKELGKYLADIELFCIGINCGVYDFEIFYKIAHGYFDSEWGLKSRLEPLLEVKLDRAEEDFFENLHQVWKRMDKHSKNQS